ncbi:MAG TPA: GlsB/YeaQ/YmgE family stress response membrane protein [Beutenbergiaceae bacterium]|nr:GlsB/YeaQ/YmgE family stress response membrane protein [Beutenbergiaceae bacterium]
MGFLAFLLIGLIAGAIARAIMKDRITGGWLASLIIGVIGALVGGWIGTATGLGDVNEFFSISTWLLAILGSVIVIAIWSVITGSRSNANR